MAASTQKPHPNYRSAKTGQYVKPEYAQKHPATTVKEPGPKPAGGKK